ncbi:MAG: hypothetical protein RL570_531 [Actinomycetota bacterium]
MPKQKTHSGAKKRFRFTGSGKIMKQQINMRHNCFTGRLQDPQDPTRQVSPTRTYSEDAKASRS